MVGSLTIIFNFISYLRALLNPLCSPYTKFEIALLNGLKSFLTPAESIIFEGQLREVNSIQRAPLYEYVNFYKLTPFSVSRDRALKFKSEKAEWILRRCRITINDEHEVVAKFWIVNSNFFSITFNQPVKKYRNTTKIKLTVVGREEKGNYSHEVEKMGK